MKNKNASADTNLVADENGNINCLNCEERENCSDCSECSECSECKERSFIQELLERHGMLFLSRLQ